jgi:protein-S-isoprenylcysteine O-methyltransferase Ste14
MTNIISLGGLFMMVGGLAGLIIRRQVLSDSLPVIGLQAVAVALMVWARRSFGRRSFHASASPTEGGVITSGPYRWVRHPIYSSVWLFSWACVVGHPSWFSLSMAGVVTAGCVARMLTEEALLRIRYPEYTEYARKTKRIVPYVF